MATVVRTALAEIVAALADGLLEHEGLRDLTRLNLTPEALREVRGTLEAFDRRVQKLEAAKAALEALLADGHPDFGPFDISDAALQDLRAQRESIDAALEQFQSGTAVALHLAASPPEAKSNL